MNTLPVTASVPSQNSTTTLARLPSLVSSVAVAVFMAATLILLSGCAAVMQSATTHTTQTNGVVSVTTARSSIVAFGDAKTVVDKVRASAGKTSSVGVSGLSEETSSSNAVNGVEAIVSAAVRAAVKP